MALETDIPFEENRRNESLRIPFEELVIQEIGDALYAIPERITFVMPTTSNLVDVYLGKSLLYRIDRDLYIKIIDQLWDDADNAESKKDCVL